MPDRVDLPGGLWVECRDPMEVTVREARAAMQAASDDRTLMLAAKDIAVGLLVVGWSIEAPLGEGLDRLFGMPQPAYSALLATPEAADGLRALFPDFAPDEADDSPTQPADA